MAPQQKLEITLGDPHALVHRMRIELPTVVLVIAADPRAYPDPIGWVVASIAITIAGVAEALTDVQIAVAALAPVQDPIAMRTVELQAAIDRLHSVVEQIVAARTAAASIATAGAS